MGCVLGLQRSDICDDPIERDKHRGLGVWRLQWADVGDDPFERDKHRGLGV